MHESSVLYSDKDTKKSFLSLANGKIIHVLFQ